MLGHLSQLGEGRVCLPAVSLQLVQACAQILARSASLSSRLFDCFLAVWAGLELVKKVRRWGLAFYCVAL